MRIGRPSVEWVLVAANVGVLICLGVVHVTQDREAPELLAVDGRAGPAGRSVLVVASERSPADLLVGAHAAEALGGELLTVPVGGFDEALRLERSARRPGRVVVLGGSSGVSAATALQLAETSRASVTRLAGADRFGTATAVATTLFEAPVARLRVMSGDALGAAREQTARTDAPLLLVEADRIPAVVAAALRQLRPEAIEVSGPAAAVSSTVVEQLERFTTGRVVRLPEPT